MALPGASSVILGSHSLYPGIEPPGRTGILRLGTWERRRFFFSAHRPRKSPPTCGVPPACLLLLHHRADNLVLRSKGLNRGTISAGVFHWAVPTAHGLVPLVEMRVKAPLRKAPPAIGIVGPLRTLVDSLEVTFAILLYWHGLFHNPHRNLLWLCASLHRLTIVVGSWAHHTWELEHTIDCIGLHVAFTCRSQRLDLELPAFIPSLTSALSRHTPLIALAVSSLINRDVIHARFATLQSTLSWGPTIIRQLLSPIQGKKRTT